MVFKIYRATKRDCKWFGKVIIIKDNPSIQKKKYYLMKLLKMYLINLAFLINLTDQ
jgi:hypothetical protein